MYFFVLLLGLMWSSRFSMTQKIRQKTSSKNFVIKIRQKIRPKLCLKKFVKKLCQKKFVKKDSSKKFVKKNLSKKFVKKIRQKN